MKLQSPGGTLNRVEDNNGQHWSAQRMSPGDRRCQRGAACGAPIQGGGTPAVSRSVSKKAASAGLKGSDLARSEGLEPPAF